LIRLTGKREPIERGSYGEGILEILFEWVIWILGQGKQGHRIRGVFRNFLLEIDSAQWMGVQGRDSNGNRRGQASLGVGFSGKSLQ
jgi:hypothetical protein